MLRSWIQHRSRTLCGFFCFAAAATLAIRSNAVDFGVPTETLILQFEEGELLYMPAVVAGYIQIETPTGTVVVDDLPGVLKLEHGVAAARGPRDITGPYRVTMIASEYAKLRLPPVPPIAKVAYIASDELRGICGENVKAWFPPQSKDLFCTPVPGNDQVQLHRKAVPTACPSDTVAGDYCTPKNWSCTDTDMDMPQAWGITRGSPEVLVAVLDTGFDWKHPEFGATFPPYACSTAESLYYFASGVFYTNPNDPLGDASQDSIPVPGRPFYDDDGDELTDEDSLGRSRENDAESDVILGEVDDVDGTTIYDFSANWMPDSLVGRWLYLDGGDPLGLCVRVNANTASSATTDSIFAGGMVFADWWFYFQNDPNYRIGDGLSNNEMNPDVWIDDEGWLNDLPNDDDENGAEDDVHGYDFLDLDTAYSTGLCEHEDYSGVDNDVFTLGSHGSGMLTQIATALSGGRLMGIAPDAKVLPVRVGSHSWSDSLGRCDVGGVNELAMAAGIKYAATFSPDIIVSAMDPNPRGGHVLKAIQDAVSDGAVYINGAGNSGYSEHHWLEAVDPVVLVGGASQWDTRWDDGVGATSCGPFVSVSARAAGLKIAVPWGVRYDTQSGTSFAGPIVAGVAALVKSAYPHMERDDVIWMIQRGVDPINVAADTLAWLGSGRVNAYRALTLYGNVASIADTTWTNELWVGGDVLVPDHRTLTIAAGTTVNVAIDDLLKTGSDPTEIEFVIDGDLMIEGESGNPVLFRVFEDGGAMTTYSISTAISGSAFTMASLPAQAAERTRYPIVAASLDTSTVVALEITAAGAIDSVTVDLYGLGGPSSVALRDDGEGEDARADDGLYTSDRCQVNAIAGDHVVSVRTWAAGGAATKQDVVVEAVANKAKFIDVSAETGALYAQAPQDTTATPYAAVYFAAAPLDSLSAEILLVTIDDGTTPPLVMQRASVFDGVPQFASASLDLLDSDLPSGSRGIAFADFDNDGDNDFFVCGVDSAVLYENRLDEVEERFVNVTAAAFGPSRLELAGSLASSWGDYNRDGFLDLVVTTTDYDGPMRLLTDPGSYNSETLVFRNNRAGSFELTGWGASATGNVVPSGCWVDLDRDGDPELVQARMVGEYPIVLDNTGYATGAGDAQLVAGNWATTGVAGGAGSVSVIDYDHDPYPDLLVTEVAAPGRAVILQNDYDGSPGSKSFTPIELAASGSWTGAVVADFDLNGQEDYLLLPRSGEPALYMADAYGTTPTYRDLAYTLGLRSGGVGGAIAGDFNNDHDPDLYLGRLKTDQFQYKNVRQNLAGGDEPAAGQKWLAVQLGTTGSSDGGLVGTEVTLTAGSRRWTQHVDGGSGRGGQRPGRLLFGLGDIAQNAVTVVARYPSGERDSVSVAVNAAITLEESEAVVLKSPPRNPTPLNPPEPDFNFELQPGSMNWVFKWRSTNVRGDLRRDVVHVQNFRGYPLNSACSIGIDEGDTLDLHWGDPGVGHLVYWDGSLWQHEVRWGGLLCYPGCEHRFSVTSATDAASSAQSGLRVTTPTTLCLPDMEEQ
jgi:subtilisin family serine protease